MHVIIPFNVHAMKIRLPEYKLCHWGLSHAILYLSPSRKMLGYLRVLRIMPRPPPSISYDSPFTLILSFYINQSGFVAVSLHDIRTQVCLGFTAVCSLTAVLLSDSITYDPLTYAYWQMSDNSCLGNAEVLIRLPQLLAILMAVWLNQ